MARTETDREDLMAEAVAMTRRLELYRDGEPAPLVIGFRPNGWLSIYLGPDRMYQFDEGGRLRRAFVNGFLFRTQGTTLARMHRERSDTETTLRRHDLTPHELAEFRAELIHHVGRFFNLLAQGDLKVLRQIPGEDAALLNDLVAAIRCAVEAREFLAPSIPGKH